MIKRSLFLIISLFITQIINAQGLIGTPHSLILVYNYPDNYFYIEVAGVEKNKTERDGVFEIDGKMVQVLTVHKNKFLQDTNEVLTSHRFIERYIDWEVNYIESSFSFNVDSKVEFIKSKNGKEIAFWTYDTPVGEIVRTDSTETAPTQKQMFVITQTKDYVVGIYSPLFLGDQFEIIKTYLLDNIDGLVESDKEIDIEELNKKVNK